MTTSLIYVYPNPTSGLVEVYSSNEKVEILSCEVFDIVGTKLLTTVETLPATSLQLNLSKIESGTYIIEVKLSNQDVERFTIVKF